MDMSLLSKISIIDFSHLSGTGNIVVITGERGAGKTTFCQQIIKVYKNAGLSICGVITPGRFKDSQKNGIFVIDLASGQSRLLASAIPEELDGIRFGHWTFDSHVFEWGNQCLGQITDSDVVVIDELGPLEFELHSGWMTGFEILRSQKYRLAIAVIRPECINAFSKMGFDFQVKEISIYGHHHI